MNFPKNINVVLVCGGRNYLDSQKVNETLDKIHAEKRIDLIVSGGAQGADSIAEHWAKWSEVDCLRIPAQWKKYGKAAGPIRNAKMCFIAEPNLVVAFPGGSGTANMISVAKAANVEVMVVE